MKHGMKRALALVLAMLLMLMSCAAFAEEALPDELSERELAIMNGDNPDEDESQQPLDEGLDELPIADENKLSGWMNVLLLGCDSYSGKSHTRSDSMIILSVNMDSGAIRMTSLMRDTWIKVPGSKSKYRKLTELCAVGGPELTMRAINENFGMNIEDYVLISMEGIAEVIDLIGGVDLDVTEAEKNALNKGLFDLSGLSGMEKLQKSGNGVHLNGNQAVAFARIRKIDSDFVRTERQRTVLLKIADVLKQNVTAGTLLKVVLTLLDYVETNLSLSDILALANVGLSADLSEAKQLRLPADGTYDSGMYQGYWSIRPNFGKNAKILHEFIYG